MGQMSEENLASVSGVIPGIYTAFVATEGRAAGAVSTQCVQGERADGVAEDLWVDPALERRGGERKRECAATGLATGLALGQSLSQQGPHRVHRNVCGHKCLANPAREDKMQLASNHLFVLPHKRQ